MANSRIEWTEETWNPSKGCTKVSEGCKHCYAETMSRRLKAMGVESYSNDFEFAIVENRLNQPLLKRKPTKYFVNSMSDLFHEEMPREYLDKVFRVIEETPQHVYQILTKREERMFDYLQNKTLPNNVWLGVTVENIRSGVPRIEFLRKINASIKFLSIEPLLEDLGEIDLFGIDWAIVGGESGHNARPMQPSWAENIKRQCQKQDVAFFFKQWGTWGADGIKRNKKKNGRLLMGKEWNDYPNIMSAV